MTDRRCTVERCRSLLLVEYPRTGFLFHGIGSAGGGEQEMHNSLLNFYILECQYILKTSCGQATHCQGLHSQVYTFCLPAGVECEAKGDFNVGRRPGTLGGGIPGGGKGWVARLARLCFCENGTKPLQEMAIS